MRRSRPPSTTNPSSSVSRRGVSAACGIAHALPVPPGTTKGWVNPSPAQTPRHLVIHGGFAVDDDDRTRQLERRAQRLGFADLRGYLQARSDAGLSLPQLAAELGFADLRAYLADRLLVRGWLLAEVTAELGAHRRTVRRLMDQHGIRRARRTRRELAAGERGRRAQAVVWQARRAELLAELGFADLAGYLQCRFVEQGWSIRRIRAELRVGRHWLVAELARLGLRR
jgi:hypothetical protein